MWKTHTCPFPQFISRIYLFLYFPFMTRKTKRNKKKKRWKRKKKEGEERSGEKEKAAILSDVAFSRAEKARKRPETGFVATVDKIEEDVWAVLNREMDKRSLVFVLFGQFNAVYRSPRNFSFFFFFMIIRNRNRRLMMRWIARVEIFIERFDFFWNYIS